MVPVLTRANTHVHIKDESHNEIVMDIVEELKRLKSLLDQGAITDGEFASLKKKVLAKEASREEPKQHSSAPSAPKEQYSDEREKEAEPSIRATAVPESESSIFEAGNDITVKIFKWGLGLCLLLGVVFWVRYDSIAAMLVSAAMSVAALALVTRKVTRVKVRNVSLGVISLVIILLIIVPIGGTGSSGNSGSANALATEQQDDEGEQIRNLLLDNTFANYGSGNTAYLRFTSSAGGWYGAMTMSMGSCDFVYSYNLEGKTIDLSYTGSNCDAAFKGSSLKMYVNDDSSVSVFIQGQEMKFSAM